MIGGPCSLASGRSRGCTAGSWEASVAPEVFEEVRGLITDIERYREAHGHYPRSLQSLWDDYRPPVVGIERFRYEPSGDGYNVYFEHPAGALDVKEVVMYNRHGAQEFTSHSADLLQRSPEQLARMRGYVAVRDAGRPRWKYFLFD